MPFGQALLKWTTAFPNFAQIAQDQRWFGWSQATVAEPCSWTGIACTAQSAQLKLPQSGLTGRVLQACASTCIILWPAAASPQICPTQADLHSGFTHRQSPMPTVHIKCRA